MNYKDIIRQKRRRREEKTFYYIDKSLVGRIPPVSDKPIIKKKVYIGSVNKALVGRIFSDTDEQKQSKEVYEIDKTLVAHLPLVYIDQTQPGFVDSDKIDTKIDKEQIKRRNRI